MALVLDGYAEARGIDLDLAYYTAWHAGAFSQPYKAGKFPDYRKHHPRRTPAQRKSSDELKAVARSITAALGGSIRTR